MSQTPRQFTLFARLLHWIMAAMILGMLLIGMAMVASLGSYHALVSLHRPLGVAIFLLAAVRLAYRLRNPPPPLPDSISPPERLVATASELAMYALMFALPLVGWGMLSAARYPIVLFGSVHLPYFLPHNLMLYATLRTVHTVLAYLFLLFFFAHFGAILYHTLVLRDGLLQRMVPWNIRNVPFRDAGASAVDQENALAPSSSETA